MAMTLVAKATVKVARLILKMRGTKGLISMSPEGAKKAAGIISRSGNKTQIQELIARSPSKITMKSIQELFVSPEKSLSKAALGQKKR
jgi:hypothetical protein